MKNFKLETLKEHPSLSNRLHDALDDSYITDVVYLYCKVKALKKIKWIFRIEICSL